MRIVKPDVTLLVFYWLQCVCLIPSVARLRFMELFLISNL